MFLTEKEYQGLATAALVVGLTASVALAWGGFYLAALLWDQAW